MNYIPSHLASLHLDELRRHADIERRSRRAGRLERRARSVPAPREPRELRRLALRRPATQG